MKNIVFSSVAALSLFASAAVDVTVEDGTGALTGAGTLALETALELAELRLQPDAAGIVLTGAGVSFTNASATVRMQAYNPTVFDVPVTAAGTLAFQTDTSLATSWSEGYLSTDAASPTTLFENLTLDDYTPVSGIGGGSSLGRLTMTVFHTRRGAGWLTCQLQVVADTWCKCVLVRLEQRGANVVGWISGARYLPAAGYGADFATTGNGIGTSTADNIGGYGLTGISLVPGSATDASVTLKKPLHLGGTLRVGESVGLTADGVDVFPSDAAITNAFELAGSLVITNSSGTLFSNVWSGASASVTFGGFSTTTEQATYTFDGLVPASGDAWAVAATNAYLSSLTNVIVTRYSGMAIPSTPNPDGQTFWLRNAGATKVCQCQQIDGSWLKCPILQFRQNGKNLEVKLLNAWYTATSSGRGVDLDTLPTGSAAKGAKESYSASSNPQSYNYGVGGLLLQFDTAATDASQSVSTRFANTNRMTGAAFVQNGGYANVMHPDGLPQSGTYTVNGGTLELSANGCAIGRGISRGNTAIRVKNGVLVQSNGNVFDSNRQQIVLDDSELRLCTTWTTGGNKNWTDANTYVNNLTLRNGSRVTTASPRLAYSVNAVWTVEGTGTSWCDLALVAASTIGNSITFDVAETTGDATADLVLKGGIRSYDVEHRHWTTIKTGAGTLQLDDASSWSRAVEVRAGEFRVNGNALVRVSANYPCPVTLLGGTLAFAADASNAVGTVTLAQNSAMTLGAGSVVTAADASGATWTDGAALAVTGPDVRNGARTGLRFGASACLTPAQIQALRYNGFRVTQDAEGWIRTAPRGTVLTYR